jgi:hypothetical protein
LDTKGIPLARHPGEERPREISSAGLRTASAPRMGLPRETPPDARAARRKIADLARDRSCAPGCLSLRAFACPAGLPAVAAPAALVRSVCLLRDAGQEILGGRFVAWDGRWDLLGTRLGGAPVTRARSFSCCPPSSRLSAACVRPGRSPKAGPTSLQGHWGCFGDVACVNVPAKKPIVIGFGDVGVVGDVARVIPYWGLTWIVLLADLTSKEPLQRRALGASTVGLLNRHPLRIAREHWGFRHGANRVQTREPLDGGKKGRGVPGIQARA